MKVPVDPRWISRIGVGVCCALCLVLTLTLPTAASADEITYTGLVVTDGSLGSWQFHNARVFLTYRGNTNNVVTMLAPISGGGGAAQIELNMGGAASVTIVTADRTEHANFTPGEVFVSLDLGDIFTDNPQIQPLSFFSGPRGVGFGSVSPGPKGGLEPAYPFAIQDGTADWGDILSDVNGGWASPDLLTLPMDLKHNAAYSGRAWVCVGFATIGNPCVDSYPLQTDKGELLLQQSYQQLSANTDSLNGGFVTVHSGRGPSEPDDYNTSISSEDNEGQRITYTAALVSKVKLGGKVHDHAQVFISFDSDSRQVEAFQDATSAGFINKRGRARVKIIDGEKVIDADIEPNQLYVYSDTKNATAGFGSTAGGRGYPFALTSTQDNLGLVENSLIFAVNDILASGDAATYTAPTATLTSDLRTPTLLAGGVSSCVSLNTLSAICSDLTPVALKTSKGDLILYEPYSVDPTAGNGSQAYSVNWGIFWAEKPSSEDH